MDPSVSRLLTSLMLDLESVVGDPVFRPIAPSKSYDDAASLTLQHPDSVVVVTSQSLDAFPRLPGEQCRFVRLDHAVTCVR